MASVKVESRKPLTIAYIEHTGPYDNIPFDRYIGRLYDWVKEKKVMPGFHPMGIFLDNPKRTPPDKCKCQLAIPVYGKVKGEGDIKIAKLPAMKVAAYSHKDSGKEYQDSYDKINDWIKKNGYTVSGPPIEIYSKKPEMVKGEMIIYAKIMFPVKKPKG